MNEYKYLRWLVSDEHDATGEIEAALAEIESLRAKVKQTDDYRIDGTHRYTEHGHTGNRNEDLPGPGRYWWS